jgi:hypothetical protein
MSAQGGGITILTPWFLRPCARPASPVGHTAMTPLSPVDDADSSVHKRTPVGEHEVIAASPISPAPTLINAFTSS